MTHFLRWGLLWSLILSGGWLWGKAPTPSHSFPDHLESWQNLPLAWTCTVDKLQGEEFTITHNFHSTDTGIWIDWGDGSAPEAFHIQVTGTYYLTPTYHQAGLYTVSFYGCEDKIRTLALKHQHIQSLDISGLSKLESISAGDQDITGSTRDMQSFIPPQTHSNHPLTLLDVRDNEIAGTLDVSDYPFLEDLWLRNNNLIGLDVSNLPKLKNFRVGFNPLEGNLDISSSTNVEDIGVSDNAKTFDPSANRVNVILASSLQKLRRFYAYQGNLASNPLDFTTADVLKTIRITGTQLSGITLPTNRTVHPLETLSINDNDIQGVLDCQGFPSLSKLEIFNNDLLGVLSANLPALTVFILGGNLLQGDIDIRQSTLIEQFGISSNGRIATLTNPTPVHIRLPVTMNELWNFQVYLGNFTTDHLDFSQAPKLEILRIRDSKLKGIVFPTQLVYRSPPNRPPLDIVLSSNQINLTDLDALIAQVHSLVSTTNFLDGGIINLASNNPAVSTPASLQDLQSLQQTYQWTVTY